MKNVFLCFTLDKQSIIVNVSSSYLCPGSVNGATFLPELPSCVTVSMDETFIQFFVLRGLNKYFLTGMLRKNPCLVQ